MPNNNQPRVKRDIHSEITNTILEQLEAGDGGDNAFKLPWHSPAGGGMPLNALTRRAYSGGNFIFLMIIGFKRRYTTSQWATYKQWAELGAQVRKGEKACPIAVPMLINAEREGADEYPDPIASANANDNNIGNGNDADDDEGWIELDKFIRYKVGNVFNRDQVDGYTDPDEKPLPQSACIESHAKAEALVAASGADIRIGGHRAFYDKLLDAITMPDRERFTGTATTSATEGWYATLLHELIHWSGAESRLARKGITTVGVSKQEYAFEELIAEFGAAFLSVHTGVTAELRADHAQYIAHWISALKSDNRAFFRAASAAEKAAGYLLAKLPQDYRNAA